MTSLQQALNEINALIHVEHPDEPQELIPISANTLRVVWAELCLLQEVRAELAAQVDDLKAVKPPMDSYAHGFFDGTREAYLLVKYGVEGQELT